MKCTQCLRDVGHAEDCPVWGDAQAHVASEPVVPPTLRQHIRDAYQRLSVSRAMPVIVAPRPAAACHLSHGYDGMIICGTHDRAVIRLSDGLMCPVTGRTWSL